MKKKAAAKKPPAKQVGRCVHCAEPVREDADGLRSCKPRRAGVCDRGPVVYVNPEQLVELGLIKEEA